jgi:bifunctional DNA-binding transcriptional regulator/antitoxin component of YhaV-PrlF toxin-antitoxin module
MEKSTVVMDKQGRLYLPKRIKKEMGRKFYIVKTPDRIILIPVPKDPVKALAELGRKAGINKYSMKQIKKMIEEEAEKEALSNLH